MTERSKREPGKKPKVGQLELNKETVQDLSEREAEAAEGGNIPHSGHPGCGSGRMICPESGRPNSCRPSCARGCTGACERV
jgi:hypothetical protein